MRRSRLARLRLTTITVLNVTRSEPSRQRETGGPQDPEPTRYGDWERKDMANDFLSRRHSGARQRRKPGIHHRDSIGIARLAFQSVGLWLWISGSSLRSAPE